MDAAMRRALARARDAKALDVDEATVLLGARGEELDRLLDHAARVRDKGLEEAGRNHIRHQCVDRLPPTARSDRIDQNEHHDRIERSGVSVVASTARNESIQDETYLPRVEEAEIIDFLSALRERGGQPADIRPRLVGPNGESVELGESMFEVLIQVASAMKAGLAVTVAPHHLTLSTQEAADLLRISRTTLVRLLESGAIPFDKPSRHRRVRLDDLLEYRRRQRRQAEFALADMVADTERLGLYDADPAEVRAALNASRPASDG
jgi:excisionase family DNA binding protein